MSGKLVAILDAKLNAIVKPLEFFSAKFGELLEKITTLEDVNSKLNHEHKILQSQSSSMLNSLSQTQADIDKQEQYIRTEWLELIEVFRSYQVNLLKIL